MKKKNKIPFEKFIGSDLCTGCGICQALAGPHAIKMEYDEKGFLRPRLLGLPKESEQRLIRDVCPGFNIDDNSRVINANNETGPNFHPLWGPVIEVRMGHATDKNIRYKGASGGSISAILFYLIEQKIVDFVVHIGASETDPLRNEIKISTSYKNILENTGSRYSPSSPLMNIVDLLKKPGKFAVVGKPCDIVSLRRYAHREKRVDEKIPYMISFMCAGVPSLRGTMDILNRFNIQQDKVTSLRYRGEGWPGDFTVKASDGTSYSMSYEDAWGKILGKYLQSRCKICFDGTGESADIVCADAWHSKNNGYPDFTEGEGRNLIITRTPVGKELISKICADSKYLTIEKEPASFETLSYMQPFQALRKKAIFSRILAMRLLLVPTPDYSIGPLWKSARLSSVTQNLKNFAGMVRRSFRSKLPYIRVRSQE